MFTLVTTTPQVLGCTPCECGIPGACLHERLPFFLQFVPLNILDLSVAFLTPFFIVLSTSVVARWALKLIFRKTNTTIINSLAVLISSLFVWPFIFSYFQPNVLTKSTPLIASVTSVFLVYALFTVFDLIKKKTVIWHPILGFIAIISLIAVATFSVRYASFTQYNQIATSKRQTVIDIIKPLGLIDRSNKVVDLLKTKDYSALGSYINPSKKINISFRDYGGVNFDNNEFSNAIKNNQLSEIDAYKRVDEFTITVDELLNVVSVLLNSNYKVDYYVDNHNYAEEGKELSKYSEADFLYELGGKTAKLTFTRDTITSTWFLSVINYFDWDYPGY